MIDFLTKLIELEYMKLKAIGLSLLLLTGLGATQTAENVDLDPGLVAPGDVLYPVEQEFDIFPMNPGEMAHEKASEMVVAEEKNLTEARESARKQLNKALFKSTDNPSNQTVMGLEKAQSVLEQNVNETPEQANQGLKIALEGVKNAKEDVKSKVSESPGTDQAPDTGNPSSSGSESIHSGNVEHY